MQENLLLRKLRRRRLKKLPRRKKKLPRQRKSEQIINHQLQRRKKNQSRLSQSQFHLPLLISHLS